MRILVLLFLVTLLSACSNGGPDSWQKAEGSGSAEIVVYYVPAAGFAMSTDEDDGYPRGVTAGLMREFAEWTAREKGVDVQLQFVREDDWSTFYATVRDSRSGTFGIGNVTITDERANEIGFSPPYMPNTAVLVTSLNHPELASWEDLSTTFAGLNALAFPGTLHETRLRTIVERHHSEASIEYGSSNSEILDRAEQGGYFAYLDGYNVWRAQEEGAMVRHHPIGDQDGEHFGVIMPLGSDWEPIMAGFMKTFYGSQAHVDLFEHHLGPRVGALVLSTAQ